MNIVADENIPLVKEFFGSLGEITLLPGRTISAKHVRHAEILLVRSVTPVNAELLTNSAVRFVGSATTGIDHVDTQWLQQHGILFADAKGSNAQAVAEYVLCCIAALRKIRVLNKNNLRVGIVGVGNVGSKVAALLELFGYDIFLNDPPRAQQEANFSSTSLAEFCDLDLICIHTPLIRQKPYPTWHLFNKELLKSLRGVILNAGRGGVIDNEAIKTTGKHLTWCLDVWEDEPNLDPQILNLASIATPHIAGYTIQAKIRGTLMIYQAAKKYFQFSSDAATDADFISQKKLLLNVNQLSFEDILLQTYNPLTDTHALKNYQADSLAIHFDQLRKQHQQRQEFSAFQLQNYSHLTEHECELLKKLGFNF